MAETQLQLLRKIDFLETVSDENLRTLAAECEVQVLAEGETLFEEGEAGDAMYIILSGQLIIAKDDFLLARRNAGDYVGEMSLIEAAPRSASVRVEKSAELMVINRSHFQNRLAASPQALMAIMKTLTSRARENLQLLKSGSAGLPENQKKKIKYLMEEAGLTPREADVALLLCDGLSDKVIARQLDMSHHTVKDHLKKIYSKFEVNSRAQLVALMHK